MPFARLNAVNEIARACGEMRFGALDSSGSWPSKTYGSSFAGEAEHVLDRTTTSVLSRGWQCNTVRCKKTTLGAPGTIAMAAPILRCIPAGPNQFRNWTFRNALAYDLEGDTGTFAAGDYFFDIITDHDFDTLPTDVQDLIIKEAKAELQGKMKGNPQTQAIIGEERAKAELGAMRPKDVGTAMPINARPMVFQQQQGNQG